jgi:hypothetical protein
MALVYLYIGISVFCVLAMLIIEIYRRKERQ